MLLLLLMSMTQSSQVELWGKGIAVKPSQGVVYMPQLMLKFQSCLSNRTCAFGLKTTDGAEVLIHVGIDTVFMNGEGFEAKGCSR